MLFHLFFLFGAVVGWTHFNGDDGSSLLQANVVERKTGKKRKGDENDLVDISSGDGDDNDEDDVDQAFLQNLEDSALALPNEDDVAVEVVGQFKNYLGHVARREPRSSLVTDHSQTLLRRWEWVRTFRCTNENFTSCEPCPQKRKNCWKRGSTLAGSSPGLADPASRRGGQIQTSGNPKWTRFLQVIHVHCESTTTTIQWKPLMVENGQLSVLWDDIELNANKDFQVVELNASSIDDEVSDYHKQAGMTATAQETQRGDHTLTMQFTVDNPSEVAIAAVLFQCVWTTKDYVACEDSKACLGALSGLDADYVQLRNDNGLQYTCLNSDFKLTTGACRTWRKCLSEAEGVGHKERLQNILAAAGFDQSADASIDTSQDDQACVDPGKGDPESWDCNCYDKIMVACGALKESWSGHWGSHNDQRCLRAQVCKHPNLCPAWKAAHCEGGSNADLHQYEYSSSWLQLAAPLAARAQRQHATRGNAAANDFDDTFDHKGCW